MTRGPDASRRLSAALERAAEAAGLSVRVGDAAATSWASATFAGARHRLTLHLDDAPGLDRWLAALPEADLPMKDHLVADLMVVSVERSDGAVTVRIEALTVEER